MQQIRKAAPDQWGAKKSFNQFGAKSVYVCYHEGWQQRVNRSLIVEDLAGCLA